MTEHRTAPDQRSLNIDQLIEKLVLDTAMPPESVPVFCQEIRALVDQLGLTLPSASLIRGLIDTKHREHGQEQGSHNNKLIDISLSEIDRIVQQVNRTQTQQLADPYDTSLALANIIKREYALRSVFSQPIANAHQLGDINIENIEQVDCLYSICLSPDYLKRTGAVLSPWIALSRPPRRVEEFIDDLASSSNVLSRCLSNRLCWDSINFALAPLVTDLNPQDIEILAASLINRFKSWPQECEIILDWQAPTYLAERYAIALDGSELPERYQDYTESAQQLFLAFLKIFIGSEQFGLPVANPHPIIYLPATPETNQLPCFELVSKLARERGNCEIRYLRAGQDAFRERYGVKLSPTLQQGSWEWRSGVFQAVTINLPRAAFQADGDNQRLFEALSNIMELAAQAQLEKHIYLEKLLAKGEQGPLAALSRRRQGSALLKLNRTLHWLCPVGLNELVRIFQGDNLHETEAARVFAAQICDFLTMECDRLRAKHKLNFLLAYVNNPTTLRRFANLDLHHFAEQAAKYLPPANDTNELSYTPGMNLAASAVISPAVRINNEAALQQPFHRAATIWQVPTPQPFADEGKAWLNAAMAEPLHQGLRIQLHFALCLDCQSALRGQPTTCPRCHSTSLRFFS